MNDGLRTDVFLRYSPETIACSCVYLSARILEIPLPESPAWWEIFSVTEEDIHTVCKMILKSYTRPKPDQERLEGIIDKLKKENERIRPSIMKQLSKSLPANETPPPPPITDSNEQRQIKVIKVEHIIKDVKRKKFDTIDDEDKRKKIHERNHSRSPRRSRSRSRDNSRRKYELYDDEDKRSKKYERYHSRSPSERSRNRDNLETKYNSNKRSYNTHSYVCSSPNLDSNDYHYSSKTSKVKAILKDVKYKKDDIFDEDRRTKTYDRHHSRSPERSRSRDNSRKKYNDRDYTTRSLNSSIVNTNGRRYK